MATRMQQRRGTAAQWTSADPILAAGEIGFETDTGEFRVGDGVNHWSDLSPFKNLEDLGGSLDDYIPLSQKAANNGVATLDSAGKIPVGQLGNLIDGAPDALNTLNELAAAIDDDSAFASTIVTSIATKLNKTGGIMTGSIDMGANHINNLPTPSGDSEAATKKYVDDEVGAVATDVTGIDTRLSTAETTITSIDGRLDSAETTITSIDGRLSTAETDINNVESSVSTLTTDTIDNIATAKSEAISTSGTNADTKVSDHNLDTTNVHGITDTSALATKAGIETLTNKTISAADNTVTINLADVIDVTASASELNILDGATLTVTELNYVDGVTSAIQTQIDAKAPTANPTFTGTVNAAALTLSGNLTVGGTTTTVNATNLTVADPLVYFGEGNTSDAVDLGFVASYNDGTYHHAGLARDASDSKWKLFSSVEDEPTTTVNFSQAVYDTLVVGGIEYSDGVQVKQGVPSITTINQQAGAYTTVLADRDKLVEVSSASGVTLTIPLNSSVAYPVGTSIDILQTNTGQVTIAGAAGVTVNATPGLKLRTQWSSATLFKRAENTWVVFGDLTA